jgi:hypothetical protein
MTKRNEQNEQCELGNAASRRQVLHRLGLTLVAAYAAPTLLIFRRDTGHRVKDLILIRNEVRDEEGKKETQR